MSQQGFSAAQIAHYANIQLDHFLKGDLFQQGIQEKPLLAKTEKAKKDFNGANENISIGVKMSNGAGGVNDGVTGFSHTDSVNFYNPGNALRANYVWREHHIGMTLSETELKGQGILVGDQFEGKLDARRDAHKLHVLHDVLGEANIDFGERYAETMNALLWGDGTADASALHGYRSFIQDIPTIGTTGGLSRVTYAKWRNRARTAAFAADGSFDAAHGGGKVTSTPANGGALLQILQFERRQMRKYGGRPDCFYAGSDLIDAMEIEIRANGNYSEIGFVKDQDGSVGDLRFKELVVVYDPTLDDLGRAKYGYIWDSKDIQLRPMKGDWKRVREPARPFNQFVLHKSMLCTGQLTSRRLNSSLVIEIN